MNKNDYINFKKTDLLNESEIQTLVTSYSQLEKAELLVSKLSMIGICEDIIYIGKVEVRRTEIMDEHINPYLTIILRKLVDKSVREIYQNSTTYPMSIFHQLLQKSYYSDMLDDIKYMLIFDVDGDEEEDVDPEEGEEEDKEKEDQEEDDDDDEEEECMLVANNTKEILKFI